MTIELDPKALEAAIAVLWSQQEVEYLDVPHNRAAFARQAAEVVTAYLAAAASPASLPVQGVRYVEGISSVEHQVDRLRQTLTRGWDGYGAKPTPEATYQRMLAAVSVGDESLYPQLVPGGDGSLQAEWHFDGLLVEFNLDEDGKATVYVERTPAS